MKYRGQLTVLAGLLATSCGSAGDDAGAAFDNPGGDAVGVGQGGSQDFGLFRQILDNGEIPAPETLDDMGFFAEHKLDYPTPECGANLCLHGLVGSMGNMINGANCTILQLGMNSPLEIDPDNRPPMHIVLAVDVSGSMAGPPLQFVKDGLEQMIDELRQDDTVSLVTYSTDARTVLEAIPATDIETLRDTFRGLRSGGATNLYDGLFTALEIAAQHHDPDSQSRVLFLSDGQATEGLINRHRMRSLAESYADDGIAITTIGVGADFDVDLMRSVGEVGSGNFYFLADPRDVVEVFSDEVNTFLRPIALDVRLELSVAASYQLRGNYGTRNFRNMEGGGAIELPALYLAGRTRADAPIEGGRRGGGGAIIFELVAKPGADTDTAVGTVRATWTDPDTGLGQEQTVEIAAPHAPGQTPEEGWFSTSTSEKAFVMLNIYAGFSMATRLAANGDPRSASTTLVALRESVFAWLTVNADPDIADDLRYIDRFIENLAPIIASAPEYPTARPASPWPQD